MRLAILAALALLIPPLGAQTPIKLASDLALSPDGQLLAFSWRNDVWLASSAGGAARRLTLHEARDRQPAFSPNGKTIAFVSDRDGSRQVYHVPVEGGAPTRITSHTEGHRLLDWYPDGSALLVECVRDHFWRHAQRPMRLELEPGLAPKPLFDAYAEDARLSPDGKRLLYVREGAPTYRKGYTGAQAAQVWMYDLEKGEHLKLLQAETGYAAPRWIDGNQFIVLGEQSGTWNLYRSSVDLVGRGLMQQLTDFEDDGAMIPTVSRDGKTAVFRRLFDLYRLDLETGKSTRIELVDEGDVTLPEEVRVRLDSARNVSFTPDAKMMAFTAGGDVWVMDAILREPVRVFESPEEERDLLFLDESTLLFISDAGGRTDIWAATRADEKLHFWQNEEFILKPVTEDENSELSIRRVPGEAGLIAVTRDRGDLFVMKPDGSDKKLLLASWNNPSFDFSPDGKWIAYAKSDDNFNSDVWIAPLDGTREPFNLSCHPDNDYNPAWSPDGKILVFTGRRWGDESDIAWVYLTREKAEETERDRKLKKALEAMKKGKKKKPASKKKETKPATAKEAKQPAPKPAEKKPETAGTEKPEAKQEEKKDEGVAIDFEGIRDRIRRIPIPNSRERSLIFWPEGQKLLFGARIDGKSGVYSVEFPDKLRPKLLSTTRPSSAVALREAKKIAGLSGGKPALWDKSGKAESFSFSVNHTHRLPELSKAVFDRAWRLMRDRFYDERLGNKNWDAVRRKYGALAVNCLDAGSLSTLCNMMLGELNGSHLGFRMRSMPTAESTTSKSWRPTTMHLGARMDANWKGPGWKIRDVIERTPAAQERSRLEAGEIILAIDGKTVDPGIDPATVLTLPSRSEVELRVQGKDGEERMVTIRPTSYGSVRSRLYDQWVESNRAMVDELSKGELGYLHIAAMGGRNLQKFDEDLYRIGVGKKGLVIDVRENGGGSITDHLLTCLSQPTHAITRPRGGGEGYPHDRRIYATWDRPIIVLCNQNSFSNAEIFSHAIKTLKRGKVVGVRTAGGVISTGGASVMGLGFIRMPFRGWYLMDGEDMELNGCKPDVEIWPMPGEWPAGKDRQLEKAVTLLLEDVKAWEARPKPKLRKASER